jgi:hypothetical protein
MESTSKSFKEAIYAPSREITAKVIFEILDEGTLEDATVTSVFGQAIISRLDQLTNKKRDLAFKYATFEPDYFLLDGSMRIPPKISDESEYEIGFWSAEISDINGFFIEDPTIHISYTEAHSVVGLTITFDTVNNEYPSEFTIQVTAFGGGVIHTENVIQNASPIYRFFEGLDNIGSIDLIVTKWIKGNRRARITEIDFGIIQEYSGIELVNLNVIEEMDLVGSTVPSNEIRFTLDNQDRLFNVLNPDGIYRFILPKQEIRAYFGLKRSELLNDFEFVSIGKYYLTEWQTDEGALTTSFIARDIFDTFETTQYTISLTNVTLFALAEDILIKSGIVDYQIDEKLMGETTNGFIEPLSVREALQDIAIAGRAIIYQDRQGKLIIERIEPLNASTGFSTFPSPDFYAGLLTVPEVTNDYNVQAINFENTFAEPQIKLNELIQSLVFLVKDGTENGTEYTFENPIGVKKGASYKIEIPLINTFSHAERVAEWMFVEYNMRGYYTANWRQNPALVCGDAVMVEDSFGQKKKARIVKQEFQFEGFLSGNTEASGGV